MCRAIWEGGRRCPGLAGWHVNQEGHARFSPDTDQERHFFKPPALLSMTPGAIKTRRCRADAYAAEVTAMRTVHGVPAGAPIGPVLREVLWQHRYQGAGLSLFALDDRFRSLAAEEGVPVEEIAQRYAKQKVRPYRASAGERLADLVVDPKRPDWTDPDRLVQAVEPPENGTPGMTYLRVVTDLDGSEFVLVTSYDGSEPMAYPHDAAGLKLAATEALERVRAVTDEPAAYEEWLAQHDMTETGDTGPWTQQMGDADFLDHSDHMHLV